MPTGTMSHDILAMFFIAAMKSIERKNTNPVDL